MQFINYVCDNYKIFLIYYLAAVNIITFIIYGIDKWKAIHERWRIRESTLIGLACVGGSVGGLLGMQAFHHKTKKIRFKVGVPVILILQVVLLVVIWKK